MKKLFLILLMVAAVTLCTVPASAAVLIGEETETHDAFNTAYDITFGKSVTGRLTDKPQDDYYRLQLERNGQIKLDFEVLGDDKVTFYIWLYDASGDLSIYRAVSEWETDFRKRLPPGTYYIRIQSDNWGNYSIDYTLSIEFTDESNGGYAIEPNGSPEEATPITLGKPIIGGFSPGQSPYDHDDYYTFTLDKKQELTIEYNFSSGTPNHVMSLYEKIRGGMISHGTWNMDNRPYPFAAKMTLEAGTYYIHISLGSIPNDTDDYTLTVKVPVETTEDPPPEPETPNNTDSDSEVGEVPISTPDSEFSAGASAWAVEQIEEAISLGIIPEELLSDYQTDITRAEFCRMTIRMLMAKCGAVDNEYRFLAAFGIDLDEEPFDDTADRYIKIAYGLKIVNGTGNGKFTPDGQITRQEAAVMLARTAAVFEFTAADNPVVFSDRGTFAVWAATAVDFVSSNKIMSGTGDDRFSPHSSYSREQAILTMLRLFRAFPREYYAI